MEITTTTSPTDASGEIRLTGRFDAHETNDFRSALEAMLVDDVHTISVSLSNVRFIDSTALAELVRGMKRCREHGGDLILLDPSDPVRVILELTRLDVAFTVS